MLLSGLHRFTRKALSLEFIKITELTRVAVIQVLLGLKKLMPVPLQNGEWTMLNWTDVMLIFIQWTKVRLI